MTLCVRLLAVALVLAGCTSGSSLGGVATERYGSTWQGPSGAPAERGSGPDRTFEVQTIFGADHCGWEDVVFLSVGWPLGTSPETSEQSRQYIRDENRDIESAPLLSTFDAEVDLPDDSWSTGYKNQVLELWFGPDNGDEAVYLKMEERVERWPRAKEHVACR